MTINGSGTFIGRDSHKILIKPPYSNGKYYQFFGALSNWFFWDYLLYAINT